MAEEIDVGQVWDELLAALAAAGAILRADDAPRDQATMGTGLAYLLNLLNSGMELTFFTADPFRPEVGRPQDPSRRWGLDCPDALYSRVAIAPHSTYVLRAEGGTPHYLGVTVTAGQLGTDGMRHIGGASAPGDLVADADGSYTITVGPGADGTNAIDISEGGGALSVRQFFYDWDAEAAHTLTIERVDGPPPPADDTEALVDRVRALGHFVDTSAATWHDFVTGLRERSHNAIQPINLQASQYGGTPDNAYGSGYLDLGPDEAAIIEVTPPPCHYWNIQFGDHWFQSLDYTYRQTALNGHQAVLDDGVFRGVVAHRDPGVANWFDTAGHRELPMTYRWQLVRIPREELPAPTLRIVAFDDLDAALPASTPRVTPAERAELLERRRVAVLRRFGRGG